MELELRTLFLISRLFRDTGLQPTELVEELFAGVPELTFRRIRECDEGSLTNALGLIEELIGRYVLRFHDPRVIPVTYYKREKGVRRHLDQQFSLVLKELARRTGGSTEPTLILEEPIYYMTQKYRERGFPRPKDAHAALELLKTRFHSDLAQKLGRDPFSDNPRRVLLPHEIR